MKIVSDKSEIKRVPTYIENFDRNIEGGIPEGFITLVAGTSGTMKSSLAFNVIYNEVVQKKKSDF